MKIESIAKALEEYKRLQETIDNIESNLGELAKISNGRRDDISAEDATSGYIVFNSYYFDSGADSVKYIGVSIGNNVTQLICDDLIALLEEKLAKLKQEQESIEL